MIFRIIIINILFVLSFGIVSGQDSIYVFKVKKPASILAISFQDTFLIKGERYLFEIKVKGGKKKVFQVKSDSLKINKVGKDLFSVFVPKKTRINKAMLKIFLRNEDGSVKLDELKTFTIIEPIMPEIYVGDIIADSVIDKRHLYEYAKLHAIYKGTKIRVLSFELETFANGTENKFISSNNSLTIGMKRHIQKLNIGSEIYFKKINCLLPNGKISTVESIRLFFDDTGKYNVGVKFVGKN